MIHPLPIGLDEPRLALHRYIPFIHEPDYPLVQCLLHNSLLWTFLGSYILFARGSYIACPNRLLRVGR